MKRMRIKTWMESRLNRKIFLSFLTVSLIPLCIVYCYINSAYSEKLRSDAFTLNQLTERNTAVLLEDYLTKIEYISNLFFDSDTQAMIRGASDPLSSYSARMALEKKVRVNLDLFKVMAYVDQVTFLKQDGTAINVMNSLGYADTIPFSAPQEGVGKRFKNQRLMQGDKLNESCTDKYVYLRQIDDLDMGNGTLGWLFIVFDRDQFDLLLQDLRAVLNTEIVMDDGQLLYDTTNGGPDAVNRLRAASVSYSAPSKERRRAERISWDYHIENLGISVTFFDDMKGVESNIRALSIMTGTVIFVTVLIILAASFLFSETIVRPVTRLHRNLVRVKEGDYTVRVHVDANSRDEVGQLALSFNEMAEELQHADQMRRDMVANVSHELRTPVSALQAMVENMADGVVEPTPSNLESILNQTHRLSDLIAFLLDLSRMEAGAASLQIDKFNFADFIDETVEPLEIADAGHAHNIEIHVPDNIEMEGDQDRLRQLFTNIIANALKHSADNTAVLIEAHENKDFGTIVTNVVNFGSQIPQEARSDIFRRFVKGKTGPGTESGGTGLGLSIARWAAQLHGGTVRVVDDPRGADFEITLPKYHISDDE